MDVKDPHGTSNTNNNTDERITAIAAHLRERYGEVLNRHQTAEAIGRNDGGLRVILSSRCRREHVPQIGWLYDHRQRAGRLIYFLVDDVAAAICYGDAVAKTFGGK